MKRLSFLLILIVLIGTSLFSQEISPEKMFYQALYAEQVDGNLTKAQSLYEQILQSKTDDRALMAKSLYRLGLIGEKAGTAKALGYYTRVIEQYPEQKDIISLVQSRVDKLDHANTFTDPRDRHKYKWVKIGNQIWMAENLAYMPWVNAPKDQIHGIWVYDYDGEDVTEAAATDNYQKFGCLYDWTTAMDIEPEYLERSWNGSSENHQGICPDGWHLPTDEEWTVLEKALGLNVGKKMKSTNNWFTEGNGDNSSGMSVLPAGYRLDQGNKRFTELGYSSYFWASMDTSWVNIRTKEKVYTGFHRSLEAKSDDLSGESWANRTTGFSVRCLKNNMANTLPGNQDSISRTKLKNIKKPLTKNLPEVQIIKPDLIKKWEFPGRAQGTRFAPQFLINDDILYIANFKSNVVFAINAITFDTLWKCITKDAISMMNRNMACKDVLLCQTINGLLALDKADGKVLWQRSGKYSGIFNRVSDEILYTATRDTMFAIRVSDGKNKWVYTEKGVEFGFPDLDGKTIFCPMFLIKILDFEPAETKGPVLNALDLESGKLLWKCEATGSIWDCFYFNGSVFFTPNSVSTGVCLYSISADSGKISGRSYLFGAGMTGRIARSENSLLFYGSTFLQEGYIFSLDIQGNINWKTTVARAMAGNMSPVIFDHKAFFLGDFEGKSANLLAVDIETGSNRFRFDMTASPSSLPIFYKNRIYIGCNDGLNIFAYPKFD